MLNDKACRLSKRRGTCSVALRKMALKVAVIVKDTGHLNNAVFPAAIQKEMARFLHPGPLTLVRLSEVW